VLGKFQKSELQSPDSKNETRLKKTGQARDDGGDRRSEEVARLIASSVPAPEWLKRAVSELTEAIRFCRDLPDPGPMRRRLARVAMLADCLARELSQPGVGRFIAGASTDDTARLIEHLVELPGEQDGPYVARLLRQYRNLAWVAMKGIASKSGPAQTAWPLRAGHVSTDRMTAERLTGLVVAELWKVEHSKPPQEKDATAQNAAELLWVAAGGDAIRPDAGLDRWRRPLVDARKTDPATGSWRAHVSLMIAAARSTNPR
jgi:hypothetical protein